MNGANDFLDINVGDTMAGEFIHVPDADRARDDGRPAADRARELVERQ